MTDRLTLSVPELAEALGISVWLARRLTASGEIPTVRLGSRRIVVPVAALNRYLEMKAAS